MTDLRKAAQQALECIERLNLHGWILADFEDEVYASIASLKAALEQPEQQAEPPQRERVVFPTMLRKMWSGGEVQAWLDENVNKERNT